jgi:hypothetical protein
MGMGGLHQSAWAALPTSPGVNLEGRGDMQGKSKTPAHLVQGMVPVSVGVLQQQQQEGTGSNSH